MDHTMTAGMHSAGDWLQSDLLAALIGGDPAEVVDTPGSQRQPQQQLRDVLSDLVCGEDVCDPLIRALAAAVTGAPNARELAGKAIDAMVSSHVMLHLDAAEERAAEDAADAHEEAVLSGRYGCEWDRIGGDE
jgi:NAD(P)H-dependent FMN reductase